MLEAAIAQDENGKWGTKDTIRAHLKKTDPDISEDELNRRTEKILTAKRSMNNQAFDMAVVIKNASTGTGFGGGAGEMFEAINRVTGGDRHLAGTMLGEMRNLGGNARRPDLFGPGFGDSVTALNQQFDEEAKLNQDLAKGVIDKTQHAAAVASVRAKTTAVQDSRAEEAVGAYGMVTARKKFLDRLNGNLAGEFDEAMATGNTEGAMEAAAKISALRQNMSAAPQENRKELIKLFQHVGIDMTAQESSDEQLGAIIETHLNPPRSTVPSGPLTIRVRDPSDVNKTIDQLTPEGEKYMAEERAAREAVTARVNELRTRAGLYEYGSRGMGMAPGGAPGAPPDAGAPPPAPIPVPIPTPTYYPPTPPTTPTPPPTTPSPPPPPSRPPFPPPPPTP